MRITPQMRALRGAVRAAGRLPAPVIRRLAGEPVEVEGQRLEPEVQLALRALNAGGETFEAKPVADGRAELDSEAWVFGYDTPLEVVQDLAIPSDAGLIPGRLYRRSAAGATPGALVYLHGGGWVLGGLGSADSVCRRLAALTGLAVVSVDYRLAPEHPFPAGVEDCLAAYRWVRDNAAAFGTTGDRVAVGGESAGGNLTLVVAQQTAGEQGPRVVMPVFPVTDLSTRHRSYELFGTGFFLTAAQMDWYQERYLADPAQASDPRVSPLLADSLSGHPPTVMVVAGFDPLRDEALAYADRLDEAGIPCRRVVFDGAIHAFIDALGFGRYPSTAVARMADELMRHFAPVA
ncbi:MAG: alpha/beta hydrolase [Micrococcales bacterium]|nr:alpha/beta hydrolase [Micrococcales bacterium]